MLWILVILVALILVAILFGPLVAGGFMLLAAATGSVILAGLAAIFLIVCSVYALGAFGWFVWWCFDPRGAGEALNQARAARR